LVAGLGLVAAGAALVHDYSRPSIRLDGVGYYMPLASVLFDRDLDLKNEAANAHPFFQHHYFRDAGGRAVDPYAVGAAVLWAPTLTVAYWLDPLRRSLADAPGRAFPSFGPRYVRAVAVGTALEAALACALLFWGLRRCTGTLAAALGVAGSALGTPLFFYALSEPSYAHAASFLACSALLVAVLSDAPGRRRVPLALLGALWGLATLVRWQDAVLGLLLAPRLIEEAARARRAPGSAGVRLGTFALAAVVVFLPQIVFWRAVYGESLVLTVPGNFMRWGHPQLLPMLFSTWHGAFVWCPLLLVGFVGLALLPRRDLRWATLGAVAFEIYACAAASDWWGSGAFGPRRLTAVAPLAGLGLALFVQRAVQALPARRARAALVAIAAVVVFGSGWTLRLARYSLAGLLPYNPEASDDYLRHYPPNDPHTRPYALWDHARLGREILEAEQRLRSRRAVRGGSQR
jgi:hypothetical protein